MLSRRSIATLFPLIAAAVSVPAWGQNFQGAVFSSDSSGSAVQSNFFANKADVYLSGGPHNDSGSGLPIGTYYFQVTTPNGVLLSTDAALCRQVVVTAPLGVGRITGVPASVPAGCTTGFHLVSPTPNVNGAVPVQLMPYNNTDNPGGNYKMWLIAQSNAIPGCSPTIGLDGITLNYTGGCTKTNTFKVQEGACTACDPQIGFSGTKYYDANGNGVKDPNEIGLSGWTINVTANSILHQTTTDSDGNWSLSVSVATSAVFTVCEVNQAGWTQSGPQANALSGTGATADQNHCWNGTTATDVSGLNFGNNQQVSGMKYFDGNRNGVNDLESGIAGFKIDVAACDPAVCPPASAVVIKATTDANGAWSVILPGPNSSFVVCEEQQTGYTQSGPLANAISGTAAANAGGCWVGTGSATRLDFGNYIQIKGKKYYDPSTAGIQGWPINITCSGGTGSCQNTTTAADGTYVVYPSGPIVSYTVCEGSGAGFTQTYPNASTLPVSGATVASGCAFPNTYGWSGAIGTAAGSGLNFGNTIVLAGSKFYDLNLDGVQDNGETGIGGFKISITYCTTGSPCGSVTYPGTTVNVLTGVNGGFSWTAPVQIASYNVCEVKPSTGGWTQISTPVCYTAVIGDSSQTALNFGNVCEGIGVVPYTQGFWHNNNGTALLTSTANYPAWAIGLNTLDANTTAGKLTLVPGTGTTYMNTLLASAGNAAKDDATVSGGLFTSTTSANAANMLSTQLATMELNTLVPASQPFVNATALMKVGTAPQFAANGCATVPAGLNSTGYAPIANVEAYASQLLQMGSNTSTASSLRSCQVFVQQALNSANNNQALSIIQPQACPVVYP